MQTDLITKVYFDEHLTHSCVGMPKGLQALPSSFFLFCRTDRSGHQYGLDTNWFFGMHPASVVDVWMASLRSLRSSIYLSTL